MTKQNSLVNINYNNVKSGKKTCSIAKNVNSHYTANQFGAR